MTTEQLPPGPARREEMLDRGQNISPADFTAEERAAMAAETAEVRKARVWTPFPEHDVDAS